MKKAKTKASSPHRQTLKNSFRDCPFDSINDQQDSSSHTTVALIETKNRHFVNLLLHSRLQLDIEVVDHPSKDQAHLRSKPSSCQYNCGDPWRTVL